MNTFLGSLKVMGLGMLGIFIVTIVLIVIMMLLTKIFPARTNGADSIKLPTPRKERLAVKQRHRPLNHSHTTAQTSESQSHNHTDR